MMKKKEHLINISEEGRLGRSGIQNSTGSGEPLNMGYTPSRKVTYHRESDSHAGLMANTCLHQKLLPLKGRHTSNISMKKRGWYVGNLKKTLVRWRIKNRAEPILIPFLLHGISLWRKGNLPRSTPNLRTQEEAAFNNKNSIGRIQALTGLLAHELAETKNAYLESLGDKVTGQRWVS